MGKPGNWKGLSSDSQTLEGERAFLLITGLLWQQLAIEAVVQLFVQVFVRRPHYSIVAGVYTVHWEYVIFVIFVYRNENFFPRPQKAMNAAWRMIG